MGWTLLGLDLSSELKCQIHLHLDPYQHQIPEESLLQTRVLVKLLDVMLFGHFRTSYLSTCTTISTYLTYKR